MLAFAAELARVVGDAGVDHDAITHTDAGDARPYCRHLTRAIGAHDVRKRERRARQPTKDEEIEMIESGGADRDADFLGARRNGIGDVADSELGQAAGTAKYASLHEGMAVSFRPSADR
jgi:hypothetical protein